MQEHPTPHHNQRLLNPERVDRGVFRRAESIASNGESMRLLVVEIFRKSNLVECDIGRFPDLIEMVTSKTAVLGIWSITRDSEQRKDSNRELTRDTIEKDVHWSTLIVFWRALVWCFSARLRSRKEWAISDS